MVAAAVSPVDVAPVPRLWPGSTVVCLGTGPSLTQADVDVCRGRARVIAIKDAVTLAPWADVLYSADERWWAAVGPSLTYAGPRFGVCDLQDKHIATLERAGVHRLLIGGVPGLHAKPTSVCTGNHSGFSAINLAVHLGARTIVLLGYDMKAGEDGRRNVCESGLYDRKKPPYQWLDVYQSIVDPLTALGVRVLNASRETALTVFPRVTLEEALA